jgi:hypothetical protein
MPHLHGRVPVANSHKLASQKKVPAKAVENVGNSVADFGFCGSTPQMRQLALLKYQRPGQLGSGGSRIAVNVADIWSTFSGDRSSAAQPDATRRELASTRNITL